jgi:hypothetical protein
MITSLKSTRWILLVVAIIVLAGMGAAGWIWYADYRTWHNSNAAPLFAQIDPADGATVYESELWIHWNSGSPGTTSPKCLFPPLEFFAWA